MVIIMLHEEKKVAKIVEELTMFFFTLGADEINSAIKKQGDVAVITVEANYQAEHKSELPRLEKYLKGKKNDGLEDIYWELAGSGDPGETSQLLLVGMMIDDVEIQINNDKVKLVLYRTLQE